jgi:hypothetical protein
MMRTSTARFAALSIPSGAEDLIVKPGDTNKRAQFPRHNEHKLKDLLIRGWENYCERKSEVARSRAAENSER